MFPASISEHVFIVSDDDIASGMLLQHFDEEVLPIALGGKNNCDNQANYDRFANTIRDYSKGLKAALQSGLTVKEWELANLQAKDNLAVPDSSTEEAGISEDTADSLSRTPTTGNGGESDEATANDAAADTAQTSQSNTSGSSPEPPQVVDVKTV